MGDERWFYRDEQEWTALVERLKLTSCPHCKATGTLIRHGSWSGIVDPENWTTSRTPLSGVVAVVRQGGRE